MMIIFNEQTEIDMNEAKRLAQWLEHRTMIMLQDKQAAAELRRLSAINAELVSALTQLISRTKHLKPCEGTLQLAEQALEKAQKQ